MVKPIHKTVYIVIVLLACFGIDAGAITGEEIPGNKVLNELYIIENKGQVTDERLRPRPDIDCHVAGKGISVFAGSGHLHYQWYAPVYKHISEDIKQVASINTYRLDVILEGADPDVHPVMEDISGYYEHYYLPQAWDVTARAYKKITYRNIYPNIDWVLYTGTGKLKYDFIVHPGGDVKNIRLKYEGATAIAVANGDVTVTTPFGTVTEKAPYTYYAHTGTMVPSSYQLEGNSISFAVAENTGNIVIDPTLEWGSYYGGSAIDEGQGLASDSTHNIYMVGKTHSSSMIVTSSSVHQSTIGGADDGYIIKFNPAGVRQWATYYGGGGNDIIYSITRNAENDLFFAGVTDTSSTLSLNSPHHANHGGGASDCFFGKINTAGQVAWASYYGGEGEEDLTNKMCIHADANNNLYLAGATKSDTGIAKGSSVAQSTRVANYDGFIAKFNKNGVRQWGTYYGGTADDKFTKIATDVNGTVYVAGKFASTSGIAAGSVQQSSHGGGLDDALLAKFDPVNGSRIWATYFGGTLDDDARGLAIDNNKNIYISGSTNSGNAIATVNQTSIGGQFDAFVAKFDTTGQRVWGTYIGGGSTDHGGDLVLDAADNPVLVGRTASDGSIATQNSHQTTIGTNGISAVFDAYAVILTPAGGTIWGTYYGGPGQDYGYGVTAVNTGHIYICGFAGSDTAIAYSGSQNTRAGANDAFIAKFTPDTSVFIFQPFTQTVHCVEDSFNLNYGVTSPFAGNNTFTVQLSNSSGSFANPTVIGTKTSGATGVIRCGIPANQTGNGFRIRIIATNPVDTSFDNGNNITIKAKPAKPVASSNTPVCANATLILNASSATSGVNFSWTGPGGYFYNGQPGLRNNLSTSHSGDYVVTANLNGCTRKDTTAVTVISAPAKPVAQSNSPLCSGQDLQLSVTNVNGTTYGWTGPNNYSNGSQTVTITNVNTGQAGDYIFTSKFMNGCESKDTANVVIGQTPAPLTVSGTNPVCSSDTLKLFSSTTTGNVSYAWQGPGGFSSSSKDTIRTNLQTSYSGDYIVTATHSTGCLRKDTVKVTVLQAPDKPVASANTPLCTGDDLQLTGGNITTGSSVSWNGPNGYSTSSANPQPIQNVQLSDAGNYVLTSTLNGCHQRDTVSVSISTSTIVNVNINIAEGTVVCPTADLNFSVFPTQPGGTKYTWTGPGGWNDTGATPKRTNVTYADSGYYVVKVIPGFCKLGWDSVFVNVTDTISSPVISSNAPVCEGDTLRVKVSHPSITGGNPTITWNTPGGTNMGVSVTYVSAALTDGGNYYVTLESGGCTAYDTANIIVKPKPPKPTASNNSPICENETLQLDANTNTPGVTYEWRGPAGFNSTSQNASIPNTVSGTHAGTYQVKTILNGCSSEYESTVAIVHPNPKPVINSNSPVCEGKQMALNVTPVVTDETYSWTNVNGTFSGSGASTGIGSTKLTDKGQYIVKATSNTTGCEGKDTALVEVVALPGKMELSYEQPACEGQQLKLHIKDTSAGVDYAWTGPNSFTFLAKEAFRNELKLSDAGYYKVVASRAGCTISDSIDVVVKPTPAKPVVTSNSPIQEGGDLYLKVTNPTPGASFRWTGPNGFGSFVQNPELLKVTIEAEGTYTLTTILDGCTSSGITIVYIEAKDLEQEELVLFPNPNKGTFTVKAKVLADQVMPFEVINPLGMIVYRSRGTSVNLQMEEKVEIEGVLSSGVYIFRIMMSGRSHEIPFTIVR